MLLVLCFFLTVHVHVCVLILLAYILRETCFAGCLVQNALTQLSPSFSFSLLKLWCLDLEKAFDGCVLCNLIVDCKHWYVLHLDRLQFKSRTCPWSQILGKAKNKWAKLSRILLYEWSGLTLIIKECIWLKNVGFRAKKLISFAGCSFALKCSLFIFTKTRTAHHSDLIYINTQSLQAERSRTLSAWD